MFFIGPLNSFFNDCLFFKFINKCQKKTLRCLPCAWFFIKLLFFLPNDSPSKTEKKNKLFHLKNFSCSQDIQIFVLFSLPFHIFQIQKDKWTWIGLHKFLEIIFGITQKPLYIECLMLVDSVLWNGSLPPTHPPPLWVCPTVRH